MAKKIKPIYWVLIVIAALFLFKGNMGFLGAAVPITDATITRSMDSTSVKAGSTFDVTYTAAGSSLTSGTWGVIIEDDISGGCNQAILGTNLDFQFTSDDGLTNTKTITAPGSAATCVFGDPIGTYVFGGETEGTEQDILGTTTIEVCVDTDGCPQAGWCSGDIYYECGDYDSDVCQEASSGLDCATSNQECQSGTGCVYNCATLKTDFLSAVTTWANNPTSTLKSTALQKLVLWATNC